MTPFSLLGKADIWRSIKLDLTSRHIVQVRNQEKAHVLQAGFEILTAGNILPSGSYSGCTAISILETVIASHGFRDLYIHRKGGPEACLVDS